MSKPTPERKMRDELKRKAIRKQQRFDALPDKIHSKKEKKTGRAFTLVTK